MSIIWGSTIVTTVKWGSTTCSAVYWGSTKVFPTNQNFISYRSAFNQYIWWTNTSHQEHGGNVSSTDWTCTATSTTSNSGSTNATYSGCHTVAFVSKSKINASLYKSLAVSATCRITYTSTVSSNYTAAFANLYIGFSDNASYSDGNSYFWSSIGSQLDMYKSHTYDVNMSASGNISDTGEKYLTIGCTARPSTYNYNTSVYFTITGITLTAK